MFSKLLLIVCGIGMIACTLLVNRQQRIETANEIASTHRRLLEQEQILWSVHNAIAQQCHPAQIRESIKNIESSWKSLQAKPRKILEESPASITQYISASLNSNQDS